jgi:hypothetical protein
MAVGLGRGPEAWVVVALTVLGLCADFIENGLAVANLSLASVATTAKFGFLGTVGVCLVSLLPGKEWVRPIRLIGWAVVPLGLAAMAADLPLTRNPVVVFAALGGLFATLMIICLKLRDHDPN